MTIYERVVDGDVVERVEPVDGDYSDTELGVRALDYRGGDGWRVEGWTPPAEPSTEDSGQDGEQAQASPASTPNPPVIPKPRKE